MKRSLVLIALALLVPLLAQQTQSLIAALPRLTETLTTILTERFPSIVDADSTLRLSLRSLGDALQSRAGELVNAVLGSALSVINLVMLIIVVPVVAFYMLLDWDRMIAHVDAMLPREHAAGIRALARDIDKTVAAFVRGMGTVCLVMAVYYSSGLMLVGLQFGLVIGMIAGLITFIPYVGALMGGVLALGMGLVQFWGDWFSLALVAGVFAFGQFMEGNVLTPRLVGRSVGLHPVWLIFALSVFGTLFGFVGMLVAVPVAAAIGVLARHAGAVYQASSLYTGPGEEADDTPPTR